eukprot:s4653_g7.t1
MNGMVPLSTSIVDLMSKSGRRGGWEFGVGLCRHMSGLSKRHASAGGLGLSWVTCSTRPGDWWTTVPDYFQVEEWSSTTHTPARPWRRADLDPAEKELVDGDPGLLLMQAALWRKSEQVRNGVGVPSGFLLETPQDLCYTYLPFEEAVNCPSFAEFPELRSLWGDRISSRSEREDSNIKDVGSLVARFGGCHSRRFGGEDVGFAHGHGATPKVRYMMVATVALTKLEREKPESNEPEKAGEVEDSGQHQEEGDLFGLPADSCDEDAQEPEVDQSVADELNRKWMEHAKNLAASEHHYVRIFGITSSR